MKKFYYRYKVKARPKQGVIFSASTFEGKMDAKHMKEVIERIFQCCDGEVIEISVDEAV